MSLIVLNPFPLPGLREHPALRVGAALLVAVVLAVAAVARLAIGSLGVVLGGRMNQQSFTPPNFTHGSPATATATPTERDH